MKQNVSKTKKLNMDIKQEITIADQWESQIDSNESMKIDEIVELARRGLTFCEEFCASRHYAGEHRCRCIRERFATPQHYEMYQLIREKYKELLALSTTGRVLNELGETTDEE